MWRLSPVMVRSMCRLGPEVFARGASSEPEEVIGWLELHDSYDWRSYRRLHIYRYEWEQASSVRVQMAEGECAIELKESAHPWLGDANRMVRSRQRRPEGVSTFGSFYCDWESMIRAGVWHCPRYNGNALSGPTSDPPLTTPPGVSVRVCTTTPEVVDDVAPVVSPFAGKDPSGSETWPIRGRDSHPGQPVLDGRPCHG